jgi:hypothetical protein
MIFSRITTAERRQNISSAGVCQESDRQKIRTQSVVRLLKRLVMRAAKYFARCAHFIARL